jgi:ABC-type polysaccharide/polyol phosphate export permease
VNLLLFPMFAASGAFFPLTHAPRWLTWVAILDPVTYAVDSMRRVALSGSVPEHALEAVTLRAPTTNVVILCALFVSFAVPAVWLVNRPDDS